MNTIAQRSIRVCLAAVTLAVVALPARAVIIVHDLKIDFSTSNNVTGPWRFYEGNTLLAHFTPVPTSLASAVSGGYWGTSLTSLNTSIMQATANGSTVAGHTDNDFLAGDMLLRTTDPSTGGPLTVTWTAPTAGSFTYSGEFWYADPAAGPFGNSFGLSLNNGPAMESLTASIGQDRNTGALTVNGFNVTNVAAGDVLSLVFNPTPSSPVGTLAGINFVIDFTPVPEPSTALLALLGGLILVVGGGRAFRP
jgi:hypothetical protein